MNQLESLFKYLKAENISLDKNEFEYQFNSHPDFPSLLAISDTLSFFNISNAAFRVLADDIGQLPNTFLASIKNGHEQFISFVEKKEDFFIYSEKDNSGQSKMTENELKTVWNEVVLLAEGSNDILAGKKKQGFAKVLLIPFVILSAVLLYFIIPRLQIAFFYVFPLMGLFLSIVALQELFNTKNELFDKFCNIASNTSCESVLKSTKWELLKKFSFSDLGMLFFSSQIIALTLFSLKSLTIGFFQLQLILLICALPVMGLSIYYQAYIEKKWCPICLTIIGVIIAELIFVILTIDITFTAIAGIELIIYGFAFSLVALIWFPLKKNLEHLNELKAFEIKANRFKRNYGIFIKMLKSSQEFDIPIAPIRFGNPAASVELSIVTSPFCGHCKAPQFMLKNLLDKFKDELCVSMYYNVNPKHKRLMDFSKYLIYLANNNGKEAYYKAMDFWYQENDDNIWLSKYETIKETSKIESLLNSQQPWFAENAINFTPFVLINGYKYPSEYDLSDLPYFIEELLHDESFRIINIDENELAEAEKL